MRTNLLTLTARVVTADCRMQGSAALMGHQLFCLGFLLCNLRVRRFKEQLIASVTDRRDYYHQAAVSDERARTNMLPFAFTQEELSGCAALDTAKLREAESKKLKKNREVVGGFAVVEENLAALKFNIDKPRRFASGAPTVDNPSLTARWEDTTSAPAALKVLWLSMSFSGDPGRS